MTGKTRWLQGRERRKGEKRGRRTLFDSPVEPKAIKLPVEQVAYIEKIGGVRGKSHGLRVIVLAYSETDGVDLVDCVKGYKIRRTSFSLTKNILSIAEDASSGGYTLGLRMIIKAAMEGKFDVAP